MANTGAEPLFWAASLRAIVSRFFVSPPVIATALRPMRSLLVKPGMELTRSTYQFRGIIESAAVAIFAETAGEEVIDALDVRQRAAVARLERDGVTPTLLDELEDLENLLHGSIVSSLSNPPIENNYRRVRNYLRLIRLDRRLTPRLVMRSLKEHLAIIDAFRRRSAADAVAAVQTHFSAALQRGLGLY